MPNTWHQLGPSPMPKWMQAYKDSVLQYHPQYQYEYWDDDRLDTLVKTHYPWLHAVYSNAKLIQKTDLGRYCVLHRHGGVYCDLDVMWFGPITDVCDMNGLWLADSHPALPMGRRGVTNYILASPPGHPFFLDALAHANVRLQSPLVWWRLAGVITPYSTGAQLLAAISEKYDHHVLDRARIVDLFCKHTHAVKNQYERLRASLAGRMDVVAIHNGGPARSFGTKTWSGNAGLIRAECGMRKSFRIKGNVCQFPIVLVGVYVFASIVLGLLSVLAVKLLRN